MTLILSGTNGVSDIDGSAATPAIRGTDANTGIFFPAADTIAFSEGGVEAMRINSSGNVQTIGTISVGNVTPSTSGAGITFPATQSASSDVNTLDDYEEGTFTPTITAGSGSAGTYTAQTGKYTKIGNRCFCEIYVACAKGTLSGQFRISSLPFTASGSFSIGVAMWWSQANGVNTIAGLVNSTTVVLYDCTSTGAFANLTEANLTSVDLRTQFSYEV